MNTAAKVLGLLAIFVAGITASSEPGEISINSPPGAVGGEGTDNIHWYQQESMRASRYAQDPPRMPDPIVCNAEDPEISCSGKPMRGRKELLKFPGLVYVTVYVEVDNRIREPWRFALRELREATRHFQRSGVPLQFIVSEIAAVNNGTNSMTSILNSLRGRAGAISERTGADLVVGLLPDLWGYWSYCGLANIGTGNPWPMTSVTACHGGVTLAHEIGHNFGLNHDAQVSGDGFIEGSLGYRNGRGKGTIMSYAENRIPFFSSPELSYQGEIWGDEYTDAAGALRDMLGNMAMAHERMIQTYGDRMPNMDDHETAYCEG